MAFNLKNPHQTHVTVTLCGYTTTIPAGVIVGPFEHGSEDLDRCLAHGIVKKIDLKEADPQPDQPIEHEDSTLASDGAAEHQPEDDHDDAELEHDYDIGGDDHE